MATETAPSPPAIAKDEMPLLGIDHVELYVGNATQAAYWFTHALGFRETAYAGLETGIRDRSSHLLEQGRVRVLLTAPSPPRTPEQALELVIATGMRATLTDGSLDVIEG